MGFKKKKKFDGWDFLTQLILSGRPTTQYYQTDDDMLFFSFLFFPPVWQHESFRSQQADKVSGGSEAYFLKQTAVNSCGTIALLHAVANNEDKMTFGEYKRDLAHQLNMLCE